MHAPPRFMAHHPCRHVAGEWQGITMCARVWIFRAAMFAACVAGSAALAEDGVSQDRIVFGQIAAIEGPAQALGLGMRVGLLAAFEEANRLGGVRGRKLELKSADDSYGPEKMIAAMNRMLAEEKVLAIVGPFTGAEFLRNPYNRYVVNIRASYFQETEAWIEHLTKDLGITNIAILYQDDAFGLAGLDGVKMAMAKRNLTLAAMGAFKRNTTAVKSALLDIMKVKPGAVVTVGTYKPVAEFIKLAREVRLDAVFVAISFVGSDALAHELGTKGAGVIVSQVVPFPGDKSIPIVASYQSALAALDATAEPGFVSLEGYLVGRFVIEALNRIPGEPTREKLLDVIAQSGSFDIGGVKLTYGPNKNQGMDQVFFTILQADGTFKPVTRWIKMVAQ